MPYSNCSATYSSLLFPFPSLVLTTSKQTVEGNKATVFNWHTFFCAQWYNVYRHVRKTTAVMWEGTECASVFEEWIETYREHIFKNHKMIEGGKKSYLPTAGIKREIHIITEGGKKEKGT